MTRSSPGQLSLYDLVFILCKRKWSLLVIIATALGAGLFWLMVIKEDGYEVSAKVLVKLGPEQGLPSTLIGAPPSVVGYRNQEANTEMDILTSRDLVAQIVDHFHLERPSPPEPPPPQLIAKLRYYSRRAVRWVKDFTNDLMIKAGLRMQVPPRDMAIDLLHRGIVAIPQRESNIVIVKLVFPAREYAATILNTYLDFYLKYRLRLYENREAAGFFQSEVEASSRELSEAERRLREFEDRGNIQAIEKQKEVLISESARLASLVAEARIARDEAADKLARLELEKRKPEPEFAALGGFSQDSFAHSILLQLAELQRQREQLRMTDLDTGVRIANNRRQFDELLRLLEANLRSVRADRQKVFDQRSAELDRVRASLRGLHDSEMEWTALKRQVRLLEEKDSFNRKKFTEAASNDSLAKRQIGSVSIVERAMDPVTPAGPRKVLVLGIIGAGSLLLALAWLALAEFFDHAVYEGDRLSRVLGAPLLAVVPAVSPAQVHAAIGSQDAAGRGLGLTHAARS